MLNHAILEVRYSNINKKGTNVGNYFVAILVGQFRGYLAFFR